MAVMTNSVFMREPGETGVLEYLPHPLNWPAGAQDVLVRLQAASVNPADTFFRQLGPYLGDGRGCVLGHDGAGVVQAVGPDVQGFSPGDRVCFCNGGLGGDPGTYADHAVVPGDLLAKVPDGVSITDAAAFGLVFITGYEAIIERAGVGAGDMVLIHGGAGGTGQVAIQIARETGARVAATVSTEEKAQIVQACGAERAINYRDEDLGEAVESWTNGAGVQMVLDNAGADVFAQSLRVLAPYGHLVTLMGTPGDLPDETAYNNNLTIHNVMMLTPMWKGLRAHRQRQAQILREGLTWLEDGRLKIQIREEFDLKDAAQAHKLLEQGGGVGKIVLRMSD